VGVNTLGTRGWRLLSSIYTAKCRCGEHDHSHSRDAVIFAGTHTGSEGVGRPGVGDDDVNRPGLTLEGALEGEHDHPAAPPLIGPKVACKATFAAAICPREVSGGLPCRRPVPCVWRRIGGLRRGIAADKAPARGATAACGWRKASHRDCCCPGRLRGWLAKNAVDGRSLPRPEKCRRSGECAVRTLPLSLCPCRHRLHFCTRYSVDPAILPTPDHLQLLVRHEPPTGNRRLLCTRESCSAKHGPRPAAARPSRRAVHLAKMHLAFHAGA